MKLAYDNALVTATLSEPNENANYPLEKSLSQVETQSLSKQRQQVLL